jgi:spore germination protein GerM
MTGSKTHHYFAHRILQTTAVLLMLSNIVTLSGCGWNPFAPQARPTTQTQATPIVEPSDNVAIYFSYAKGSALGKVEDVMRPLPEEAKQEPIRYAVNELLKGPTPAEKKQGFYSEIPAGTTLKGINREGGDIIVDLSKHFSSGGGSTSVTQRIEELKRTVYAVDNHYQLRVAVEGKPLELLGGEGLEVPDTVKRDVQ